MGCIFFLFSHIHQHHSSVIARLIASLIEAAFSLSFIGCESDVCRSIPLSFSYRSSIIFSVIRAILIIFETKAAMGSHGDDAILGMRPIICVGL